MSRKCSLFLRLVVLNQKTMDMVLFNPTQGAPVGFRNTLVVNQILWLRTASLQPSSISERDRFDLEM